MLGVGALGHVRIAMRAKEALKIHRRFSSDQTFTDNKSQRMEYQSEWKVLLLILLLIPLISSPAFASVGWEVGDIVLDFGVTVEEGQSHILLDLAEVGKPFSVELSWKLNPKNCYLQVQIRQDQTLAPQLIIVMDDGSFSGHPAHAEFDQVEALSLHAKPGNTCEIEARNDEFVTVARDREQDSRKNESPTPSPIGKTVMIFRPTSFFVPKEVTIRVGEKVVWIYADGTKEPHSVTSGACRGHDCSGGGKEFSSGPTLTKPGHRFEHVFTKPGIFHYHCVLHLGSMQGTVRVSP